MGCFLRCFGSSSKKQRGRKQRNNGTPRRHRNGGQISLQTTVFPVVVITEKAINPVSELSEKSDEQLSLSKRKRVTFDSNVTTVYRSTDSLLESNNDCEEKEDGLANSRQLHSNSDDDSNTSSVGSFPQNHRYQNFRDSDDEADESEDEDSDLDDEDDDYDDAYDDYDEVDNGKVLFQEVWSETVTTASMESRTDSCLTRLASEEVDSSPMNCELSEKEMNISGLNRNVRDRSAYVHAVLNPVQNLSQWKAVKSKGALPLKPQQKENSTAYKESSVSFKPQPNYEAKNLNKDVAVNASLSNWLISSEKYSQKD